MNSKQDILIFAGPSGGHLFPALAFAEALERQNPSRQIGLVTGRRARAMVEDWESAPFRQIFYLPDFPAPRRSDWGVLIFPFKLLAGFWASWRILAAFEPSLCVGFGSYVTFPGLVLSAWRKIPVLLHEQNLRPGRATERLVRCASRIAVSFEETVFRSPVVRSEWVGYPIRRGLAEGIRESAQGGSDFTILVMGGSQGAQRINQACLEAFLQLNNEEKKNMAVIHITGEKDWASTRASYEKLGIRHEVHSFCSDMARVYQTADMAITRSGAGTLFELSFFRTPAIVIPYPHADAHQRENARFFARHQALLYREESALTPDWLLKQIRDLRADEPRRRSLASAISKYAKPEAAKRLAEVSQELLEAQRN